MTSQILTQQGEACYISILTCVDVKPRITSQKHYGMTFCTAGLLAIIQAVGAVPCSREAAKAGCIPQNYILQSSSRSPLCLINSVCPCQRELRSSRMAP